MITYVWIICLLFTGFLLLFRRIRLLAAAKELLRRTREGMDRAAKLRALEKRHQLQGWKRKNSFWQRLEEFLCYSGIYRRLPGCTAEKWIAANLVLAAVVWLAVQTLTGSLWGALTGMLGVLGMEYLVLNTLRYREMQSVNENLLKCLNFLGNYSLTAGELTGVLGQVSRYLDEPLKGVMEECAYEAQTTGDPSLALLGMAERVEHPKFRELVRNLEVSIRYMADLTAMVESSRRSVREYLRMEEERKGMLREAVVNMSLLAAMSVFSLLTVDRLIDVSIWQVLGQTIPGRLALGICVGILLLFLRKLYGFHR